MEDQNQYRVFLELPRLSLELRKRVENYFQVRRKSGGGECGPLTAVTRNVYSIAFKQEADQQRVLQKAQHVLHFPRSSLTLTVHDRPPSTVVPFPELQGENQLTSNASNSPTCVEEYEFTLDSFLIRYLKELTEAEQKVTEKLAAAACAAPRYLDDERVLVRHLAPPGVPENDRSWKAKVDEIFGAYKCYYVVDPRMVKALLQSAIDGTDEVKVYSEVGMVAVVGVRSQVEAKVAALEIESREVEKKTLVRRLGVAKLCLLWAEIQCNVRDKFPSVQISQKDTDQLVLEGSAEEIVGAGKLVQEIEDMVLKKSISGKSPHFLFFLNDVYGGPGELGDLLRLGDDVEVDLRDAGLQFFSLSGNALDDAERKVEETFKDVKFDISNFSMVASELSDLLKSKAADINKSRRRVNFVVTVEGSVWLLGHTKEVEDLTEAVNELILDQACVEGNVILPFTDLIHCLQDLLQLHKFDYSGVTWNQIPSSLPIIALKGPSCKVTDIKARLTPFLASVVPSQLDINLPGAVRYFQSLPGKKSMSTIAQSHKCLLKLEAQPQTNPQKFSVSKYKLQDGLHILVFQGDITKQNADAIVNAANVKLDHAGGVAAALSQAGGPQVQKESSDIINILGQIPTGDVAVTTGGNLGCKKLLHAVGPMQGQHGGREKELLEKVVLSSLNLAETMFLESIAIPCISSGLFGVPILVCAESIVSAIKTFGAQGGRSLRRITLIDQREDVVRALASACDRLLPGTRDDAPTDKDPLTVASSHNTTREGLGEASSGASGGAISVSMEIFHGTIETQQLDVLVSPMIDQDPVSTRIGNNLARVVGPMLASKFQVEVRGATMQPGDIVVLENLPGLQCKAVIFLRMISWDNNQHGNAVQVLRLGVRRILTSCETKGFASVALPMLGTGAVLRFPESVVTTVLLEEIDAYKQNRRLLSPFLCRVLVHPNNKGCSKALQSFRNTTDLKVKRNNAESEVSIKMGPVTVEMIHGNIINAGTDVIVNTTDFTWKHAGVSKAILTAAGPSVWQQVSTARKPNELLCSTGPGLLACKEIVHACFKNDAEVIRKNCNIILKHCEVRGYHSVAFPAINTGGAGMDSAKACRAMLDGIAAGVQERPKSLNLIRIVMLEKPIFQAFRSEVKGHLLHREPSRVKLKEQAKQKLRSQQRLSQSLASLAPESLSGISSGPPTAVFSVISCDSGVIHSVRKDLVTALEKQLVERKVDVQSFFRLNDIEEANVLYKVKTLGISIDLMRGQSSASPQEDGYVLKGLKEDVLSVLELLNRAFQSALSEDIRAKEEATVALTVQWSIEDAGGSWRELSLRDNHSVEEAHITGRASLDRLNLDGVTFSVDLQTKTATDVSTGQKYKMKRNECEPGLELPSNWEPMQDQIFKNVALKPTSEEYKNVAGGFLQTAKNNIHKIERIQNFYLWRAYNNCRQKILSKNGPQNLGEAHLYHGTSLESCQCIGRDRFDRSYAGKIGSRFGKGVYFAVTAKYSASDVFSPPDSNGLKRLYVARVLTGRYTQGNDKMTALPRRRESDPTDCFDSLVDNENSPTMYVIFHDDQAYPEYLITFNRE